MCNEKNITFQPENDLFFNTLKNRINTYFERSETSKYADSRFYLKALFLVVLYSFLYVVVLYLTPSFGSFLAYILLGPIAILMGLNIAHDAAHGAISANPKINKLFLHTFDLLGANSNIWKNRHVFSHHTYPNILNQDADLKQTPLVRIFPSDVLLKSQRFQHIYMPFLYMLYTLNWLVVRDVQDFYKERIGSFRNKKITKFEVFKLYMFKVVYFTYILLVPMLFSGFLWWQILLGYVLMNAAAGFTITLALVPAHVASTSHFPLPNKEGLMPHSWSRHQLLTTTDYATQSPIVNAIMGGFNHHIVHHLFPKICHVHYEKLTPILKQTAKEFGITYNYESSLLNAYASHFTLLKQNGWEAYKTTLELE
jgi:linoleoyl-CoA desaturase